MDTVLQFQQYVYWRTRTTPHPPFGTVIYGEMIQHGFDTGYKNLIYFAYTLVKTTGFIAILAYSLLVMRRSRVPGFIRLLALTLYAISPIYVGWTTAISKDSSYLMMCMLAAVLALEFVQDMDGFLHSRKRMALLDGLREQGILVRWFDRPRIGNYLRISVGTDDEMDALCAALKALTEG